MQGQSNGQTWVASTGHYEGIFHRDWLGIPASGKPARLRFGEFARYEGGAITEMRTLFDLVAFCRQCGIDLLPPDRGSTEAVPPPATRDGVIRSPGDPDVAAATLELVENMIGGLLAYDGQNLESMRMERFWTRDFHWYGPGGIGTTRGLAEFQAYHQGPFLSAFPNRTAPAQKAWLAEGNYACVTGWPSVTGTHKGDYLGTPATGREVGMRVMDFWRREGDLLAENWVLIDMPDLFLQLGVDLFSRQGINN